MIKRKKDRRTREKIGLRWHNFDLESEKTIYCYLSCIRVDKRKLQKLDNDVRFGSYVQWKKYVVNKYQNFDINELVEFSRYLNQGIRIINPSHEYLMAVITVVLSPLFTKLIEFFTNIQIDLRNFFIANIIRIVLLLLFMIFIILFFVSQTLIPMLQNDAEKNFLSDYKEIIDEMISEKKNNESHI